MCNEIASKKAIITTVILHTLSTIKITKNFSQEINVIKIRAVLVNVFECCFFFSRDSKRNMRERERERVFACLMPNDIQKFVMLSVVVSVVF